MEMKVKTIPMDNLFMGQNVRLASRMSLDTLMADIASVGLQNPIQVWRPNGQELFEVLRGHRRLTAIQKLEGSLPEAYSKWFAKGIPCLLVTDIDANDALELKVDHGNELSLSDPFELQLCANLLFSAGRTEEAVVLALAGLMDRISPMKVSRRKELDEINTLITQADAAGEKLMAAAKRDEANKLVAVYRRGMVQGLHNAYRCPSLVMATLASKAGGVVADEFKGQYLPDLTTSDVKGLWKAHTQDMTILENGRPKFSQSRPGHAFRQLWEKIIAKAKEADAKPDDVRAKSMSANDILKDVKEGKFKSEIACRMASYHAGNEDEATALPALDAKAYAGDLISQYNADLWQMVLDEAAKIEKKQLEADKAETAAVTETVETK